MVRIITADMLHAHIWLMTKLEDALARLAERVARRKDGKGTLPPPSFVPPCAAKAPPQPTRKPEPCAPAAKPRAYKDED